MTSAAYDLMGSLWFPYHLGGGGEKSKGCGRGTHDQRLTNENPRFRLGILSRQRTEVFKS